MKNTLDPGLSTLSKTAIILFSTVLLLGMGAAQASIGDTEHDTIQKAIDNAPDTTVNQQLIWGEGMKELKGELRVNLQYEENYAVFSANSPSDYAETDLLTFGFDTDNNGVADYQVQWNAKGEEKWKYKEATSEDGWANEWSELPERFEASKSDQDYQLKVPISDLEENGDTFKFGVDSNGQNSGEGQTLYSSTTGESLWYNGENYYSSDNFVQKTVGETLPATITVESGSYSSFNIDQPVTLVSAEGVRPEIEGSVGVNSDASNVEINGFKFDMSEAEKPSAEPGALNLNGAGDKISIIDNHFISDSSDKVAVKHGGESRAQGETGLSQSLTFKNNHVEGVGKEAFRLWNVKEATIKNNTFTNIGGTAVSLIAVQNAEVNQNTFTNIAKSGVYLDADWGPISDLESTSDISIEENRFEKVSEDGFAYDQGAFKIGQNLGDLGEVQLNSNHFIDSGDHSVHVSEKISSETENLDARHNYWGEESGPNPEAVEGAVEWRPYFPTEQALQNSNAYMSEQGYEVAQNQNNWAEDTNSQRSNSEIRSIAQDVASSISTMSQAEVQSIIQSETEGFVTEEELDERVETIESQEETIEAQEERINELEAEVEQINSRMNETLEAIEDEEQPGNRGTGAFGSSAPGNSEGQGGIGGFFSGLFG